MVELEDNETSKRHYIWILGFCYYTVIGKGAFGQVFLVGSGDRLEYDQIYENEIKVKERDLEGCKIEY